MHCFSLTHRGHKLSFGPLPIWTVAAAAAAPPPHIAIVHFTSSRLQQRVRIHHFFLLVTNFLLIFATDCDADDNYVLSQELFVVEFCDSFSPLALSINNDAKAGHMYFVFSF